MSEISKREEGARDFLSKLPLEVLVKSVYLCDTDFKTEPFEEILEKISSLVIDINRLNGLIQSYENPDSKILRKSSNLSGSIYKDYQDKNEAVRSILANSDIIFLLNLYLNERENKEDSTSRKPR